MCPETIGLVPHHGDMELDETPFDTFKTRPRFWEKFLTSRRVGLSSCTVGHNIYLVYMQSIDENPCSQRYVDRNTGNTLMGTSATYGYDSPITDQQFGRVRASNASHAMESLTNFNRSSSTPSGRDRTFRLNDNSAWNPCFHILFLHPEALR